MGSLSEIGCNYGGIVSWTIIYIAQSSRRKMTKLSLDDKLPEKE